MTHDEELELLNRIMSSTRIASVTTRTNTGELHSRPLAVIDRDFDGTVWFFTQDPSGKTVDVATDNHVNVAYSDGKDYLSLAGTASVSHDPGIIDELWNPFAEAWFENGREDPTVALLRIEASSAEYWSNDKPAVARVIEVVTSLVTRRQPDVGETGTVQL